MRLFFFKALFTISIQTEENDSAFVIMHIYSISFDSLMILIVSIDSVAGLACCLENSTMRVNFLIKGKRFGGRIIVLFEVEVYILKGRLIAIGR